MASTDSMPVPKKGVAFRLYFTLRTSSGAIATGFTSSDSEVSKDGAAFADCTNEATYVGRGNGYIDLTVTEMNADAVSYYMTCTEGDFDITFAPEEAGDLRANATQFGGTTVTGRDIGASVLLSPGTGTGQVSLSSGKVAATVATTDAADLTTLLSRLTSSRASYLDNLSGGTIATQADINALNQSASRRILLTTVGQYERPESGSVTYQIESRTYTGDGALVNADSTPTLTATGLTTGSLAGKLGSATSPSTGVYRWAYTCSSSDTIEQVRFDLSAVISSDTQTMSLMTQVADFVSATFTASDRSKIDAVYNKLPDRPYLAGMGSSSSDLTVVSSNVTFINSTTTATGNKLGPIEGSGDNTVLGILQAIARSDAPLPTDIGGSYDPIIDSLEAQQGQGEAMGGQITAATEAILEAVGEVEGGASASEVADAVWARTMSDLAAMPGFNATALQALNVLFMDARNAWLNATVGGTTRTTTYRNDGTTPAWVRTNVPGTNSMGTTEAA